MEQEVASSTPAVSHDVEDLLVASAEAAPLAETEVTKQPNSPTTKTSSTPSTTPPSSAPSTPATASTTNMAADRHSPRPFGLDDTMYPEMKATHITMINIFADALREPSPFGDTTETICTNAAAAIDAQSPGDPVESSEAHEKYDRFNTYLWQIWDTVVSLARSIPYDAIHPGQETLLGIILALKKISRGPVETWGAGTQLWDDLPMFRSIVIDHIGGPQTMRADMAEGNEHIEETEECIGYVRNQATFLSRCMGAGLSTWGDYPETFLQHALEGKNDPRKKKKKTKTEDEKEDHEIRKQKIMDEKQYDYYELPNTHVITCEQRSDILAAAAWVTYGSEALFRQALRNEKVEEFDLTDYENECEREKNGEEEQKDDEEEKENTRDEEEKKEEEEGMKDENEGEDEEEDEDESELDPRFVVDENEKYLGLPPGPLFLAQVPDARPDITPERWEFWKQEFQAMLDHPRVNMRDMTVAEDLLSAVTIALQKMKEAEPIARARKVVEDRLFRIRMKEEFGIDWYTDEEHEDDEPEDKQDEQDEELKDAGNAVTDLKLDNSETKPDSDAATKEKTDTEIPDTTDTAETMDKNDDKDGKADAGQDIWVVFEAIDVEESTTDVNEHRTNDTPGMADEAVSKDDKTGDVEDRNNGQNVSGDQNADKDNKKKEKDEEGVDKDLTMEMEVEAKDSHCNLI